MAGILDTVIQSIPPPYTGKDVVPADAFLYALQNSNLPLSEAESLALTTLLSRESSNGVNLKLLQKIKKGEFIAMKLA